MLVGIQYCYCDNDGWMHKLTNSRCKLECPIVSIFTFCFKYRNMIDRESAANGTNDTHTKSLRPTKLSFTDSIFKREAFSPKARSRHNNQHTSAFWSTCLKLMQRS